MKRKARKVYPEMPKPEKEADHLAMCSCSMCGNARTWLGPTKQEMISEINFVEQVSEYYNPPPRPWDDNWDEYESLMDNPFERYLGESFSFMVENERFQYEMESQYFEDIADGLFDDLDFWSDYEADSFMEDYHDMEDWPDYDLEYEDIDYFYYGGRRYEGPRPEGL